MCNFSEAGENLMSEQRRQREEVDLSVGAGGQHGLVRGDCKERDTGQRHVGDAAVLRAAVARLALLPHLLTGLDELLGLHRHKPWTPNGKP